MAHRPIDLYLNDHLAGATFAADLARQLEARTEGTDFQPEMSRLAAEIEADLDTLTDLMERIGTTRNPSKQLTAWVAEKASRLKLTGLTSGDDERASSENRKTDDAITWSSCSRGLPRRPCGAPNQ